MTRITWWLKFQAWLGVGNARRRLGGLKAAQTRRLRVALTSNGAPDHLSVPASVAEQKSGGAA
jgi:hypothetical protein